MNAVTALRPSAAVLGCLMFAGSGTAWAQTAPPSAPIVRASKVFTVYNAPPGPWDLYVTLARLPAGFWTGPHTHPGPEFGLIVAGQALRWYAGKQRVANAGDGYFAPSGQVHEGGASVDGTLQLSVHLIPQGRPFQMPAPAGETPATAPPPAAVQARLFQSKFVVSAVPDSSFTLVERIVDVPPGVRFVSDTAGLALATVIAGHLLVTVAGATVDDAPGATWTRPPGTSVTIRNAGADTASFMVATVVGSGM